MYPPSIVDCRGEEGGEVEGGVGGEVDKFMRDCLRVAFRWKPSSGSAGPMVGSRPEQHKPQQCTAQEHTQNIVSEVDDWTHCCRRIPPNPQTNAVE